MCGLSAPGEGECRAAEVEHDEGDQGLGRVEPEGHAGEESDLGVSGLDQALRQPVLQAGLDGRADADHGLAELLDGFQGAAPGLFDPGVEDAFALLTPGLEDDAEFLFERVGLVEAGGWKP